MTDSKPSHGEDSIPDKLYFRIGEVSELVGVEPHVLRYWETEFRMRPHRSSSGQRLYRKRDIGRFLRIQKLLHSEGFTIAGARKVLKGSESISRTTEAVEIDVDKLVSAASRIKHLRSEIASLKEEVKTGL
jgi:DNA-binding transcriptional MerR regulator